MRYWPLTAVLLAFWMGRETGADTARNVRFDAVYAKKLVLRDGAIETKIEPGAIRLLKGGKPVASLVTTKGHPHFFLVDDAGNSAAIFPSRVSLIDSGHTERFSVNHKGEKAHMHLRGPEGDTGIQFVQSPSATGMSCKKKDRVIIITPEGVEKK